MMWALASDGRNDGNEIRQQAGKDAKVVDWWQRSRREQNRV